MYAKSTLGACVLATLAMSSVAPGNSAPAADPATLPIIDLHAHFFNLRYLPVEGVLVARGVPLGVAQALDRLLVSATRLADLSQSQDQLLAADLFDVSALPESEARQWVLNRIMPPGADRQQVLSPEERRALRRYVKRDLQRADRPPGEANDRELIEAALDNARLDPHGGSNYFRFLATLMQDEVSIVRLARQDYPPVALFTAHLMDMQRPYNDPPRVLNDEQIERLGLLERRFPGEILGFVAFDPFRRKEALRVVRDAIESGKAVGVKFYPPSGYRASGNGDWPKKPSWWQWWQWPRRAQWLSRYDGWNREQLNDLNKELFAYCQENHVPILAHCTPDGFEAVDGYGQMSDPRYWRKVLEEYPQLRLCLAHAGGGKSWFSNGTWTGDEDFDQRAWSLATQYANVYLDLSYADEILTPAKRDFLRARLHTLLADTSRPYRLGDKLIWGSDWHMVSSLDHRREILTAFLDLFTGELDAYRARFFAGNAARFLRLPNLARRESLSPKQRERLTELVRQLEAANALPATPGQ